MKNIAHMKIWVHSLGRDNRRPYLSTWVSSHTFPVVILVFLKRERYYIKFILPVWIMIILHLCMELGGL